jgi:Protein of unknown function (DUF3551)
MKAPRSDPAPLRRLRAAHESQASARSIASFTTAGAVISVVAVPDAVARSSYPYCAMSRGADVGYQDCSYATFEACLEEIRGLGGFCQPHARYVPPPIAPQRDRRYPRRAR